MSFPGLRFRARGRGRPTFPFLFAREWLQTTARGYLRARWSFRSRAAFRRSIFPKGRHQRTTRRSPGWTFRTWCSRAPSSGPAASGTLQPEVKEAAVWRWGRNSRGVLGALNATFIDHLFISGSTFRKIPYSNRRCKHPSTSRSQRSWHTGFPPPGSSDRLGRGGRSAVTKDTPSRTLSAHSCSRGLPEGKGEEAASKRCSSNKECCWETEGGWECDRQINRCEYTNINE